MVKSSAMLAGIAKRLEGKVAVITGGAGGIGETTARLFARHGAKIVIADVQDELGNALCENMGSQGAAISYVHCDVSSESHVKWAVDTAVTKYGKLDIMLHNAAISEKLAPGIMAVDHEEFKRVFEVNVFGAFMGAKHAARVMIPAKKGTILFTSSLSSVIAGGPHIYTASKHAIVGLTKNLCVELGKYGIRVNCISPFAVATPKMIRTLLPGMEDKQMAEELICEAANLKGVVLESEDVAEAALYLASEESKYISGMNLAVDGGYSTVNPTFDEVLKKKFSLSLSLSSS